MNLVPTCKLRFVNRSLVGGFIIPTLQQLWEEPDGYGEWRDVETKQDIEDAKLEK